MKTVYQIQNNVNGKVYIGQTTQRPNKRWAQHLCKLRKKSHGNKQLQQEFNVFSEAAFVFTVIESLDSFTFDSKNIERYWIDFFNSILPESGYNQTNGGLSGFEYTENAKENSSLAQTKTTSEFKPTSTWRKDNPRAVKFVKKSESKKGTKNPMYGKKPTNRRPIKCIETCEEFESIHDAGRKLKILPQNIYHQLKGKYRRTGGHTFEYL